MIDQDTFSAETPGSSKHVAFVTQERTKQLDVKDGPAMHWHQIQGLPQALKSNYYKRKLTDKIKYEIL